MKADLDLNPKKIQASVARVFKKFEKYMMLIAIIVVVGLYGFLVMQISTASQQEPSEDDIALQLSTIKRLRVDEESIKKIQQLEDQNIVVQSLFETARNDPFKE